MSWRCTSCAGENPDGTKFCGYCGTPAAWRCASCGGENPSATIFCGHCGAAAQAPTPVGGGVVPPDVKPADPREAASGEVVDALKRFVARQVATKLLDSGGAPAEERRLVTAVFADVSGFTPLAHRLDAEQLADVIDPLISRLSDIVGRYDGVVEKFMGDALLAMFGAPTTHEDDAERALLVALEMHKEVVRASELISHDGPPLELHIGVNSGHVVARTIGSDVRMDYAVLGDAVNMAQRLEAAAPAGETYVGEMTYRLAESRFEFESVGQLTLKGKPEPVPAWRLVRERQRRRHHSAALFVGRARELDAAGEVLDRLGDGRGGVISVVGEPGVGKSRLMSELRGRQRTAATWLPTRCISYGAGIAYHPYVDLVRRMLGIASDEGPREAAAKLREGLASLGAERDGAFLAPLLGLPAEEGVEQLEPEAFRRGLQNAVTSAIGGLTRQSPVVLVLEDVHWADPSSVELTAWLTRLVVDHPVVLYLTARPDGAAVVATIEDLVPARSRRRIALEALGPQAVDELLGALLGGRRPPAELVKVVHDRAGGNPFFAEEIVRSIQDAGALVLNAGRWEMTSAWDENMVPPTVEGVLAARIDLLPHAASAVLQAASVIGRRVPFPLLRAVAHPDFDVEASVDALSDAGLLVHSDEQDTQLVFRHALVQDVAYSRLLRKNRRRLHVQVAETAERIYGSSDDVVPLLARHLYLGETGARALPYLVRAGERSRRLFANEEALVYFRQALEIAKQEDVAAVEIPQILRHLGDLCQLVGRFEEAADHYRAVLDVTNDAEAWRGLATSLRHSGEYQAALDVIDSAFASGLSGHEVAGLWLERGWTLSFAGRYKEGNEALKAGLKAAPSDDDPIAGQLLLQLGKNEVQTGDLNSGLAHALRAREILEKADDLDGVVRALRVIGGLLSDVGRFEDAAATLRGAIPLAEKVGRADELAGTLMNLGVVELDRGEFEAALIATQEAIDEFERMDQPHGRAAAYANLGEILMNLGRHDEALERLARGREVAHKVGYRYVVADADLTTAQVLMRTGRFHEAADIAERAAALFTEMDALPAAAKALRVASDASRAAEDSSRATRLESRARALSSPADQP